MNTAILSTAVLSTDTLSTQSAVMYQQWVCNVCGWIYDEAAGAPDHGLQPGTRLQDIPDDWYCPECGVTKADFIALDF